MSPAAPVVATGVTATRPGLMNAAPPHASEGEWPGNAPATASRPEAADRQPVRIHVEHRDQGSIVWIGLDGDAAFISRQAHAIVAELAREIRGTQCRLATVVCNGAVVYGQAPASGPTSRKEPPWR